LSLDQVKLFVRCASHTAIRTYIMVAVAVHGNYIIIVLKRFPVILCAVY